MTEQVAVKGQPPVKEKAEKTKKDMTKWSGHGMR